MWGPPLGICRDRHVQRSYCFSVFEPRAARCASHVKSPICAIHCFSASMSCVSGDWFGFSALGFLVVVFRAFFFLGSSGLLLVYCALGSTMGSLSMVGTCWLNGCPTSSQKKEEDEQRTVRTMPTFREELSERYALMGRAWEMVRLRSPTLPLLRDYTPAIFNETLLGFLFGDKVFNYAGYLGVSFTAPLAWPFIVHFEYIVREKVSRTFGSIICHWPSQSMRLFLTWSSFRGIFSSPCPLRLTSCRKDLAIFFLLLWLRPHLLLLQLTLPSPLSSPHLLRW